MSAKAEMHNDLVRNMKELGVDTVLLVFYDTYKKHGGDEISRRQLRAFFKTAVVAYLNDYFEEKQDELS